MINLLPNDYRKDLLYARQNATLRNWIIVLIVALLGVLVIVGCGFLFLQNEARNQSKTLAASQNNLKSQDIEGTTKQLDEISTNTKLILQVLDREILFSKLLRQLGSILPANTALQQIEIADLKGGIALQAGASSIESATQLQLNLQDPNNKIFQKADIESINCTKQVEGSAYPCTVQLRALFNDNNPYKYITNGAVQ